MDDFLAGAVSTKQNKTANDLDNGIIVMNNEIDELNVFKKHKIKE